MTNVRVLTGLSILLVLVGVTWEASPRDDGELATPGDTAAGPPSPVEEDHVGAGWWQSVSAGMREAALVPTVRDGRAYLAAVDAGLGLTWKQDGSVELRLAPRNGVQGTPLETAPTLTMRTAAVSGVTLTGGTPGVQDCTAAELAPPGGCAERLTLQQGYVTSWWDADARGLRQGWTIHSAPDADELRIHVEVPHEPVHVEEGALQIGQEGMGLLGSDLKAWDATGRALPVTARASADGFVLVADATGARFPVGIDPTWVPWTWSHAALADVGEDHGVARVASAGDVNGDGHDDVVVGFPLWDDSLTFDQGRVLIFHGSEEGLSAEPDLTLTATEAGTMFGHDLAGGGDLDGDGYADLAVGAYQESVSGIEVGVVRVYMGSATGLASTPDVTLEGTASGGEFGRAMSTDGDLDGDGVDDLVVGAPFDAGGQVRVYLGGTGGLSSTAARTWSATDAALTGRFGMQVEIVGDLDGDGHDDVVVGEPYYDDPDAEQLLYGPTDLADVVDNGVNRGRVHLFLGDATGGEATAEEILEGLAHHKRLGERLARAGDVDGDGEPEFLVRSLQRSVSSATYSESGADFDYVSAQEVRVYSWGDGGLELTTILRDLHQAPDPASTVLGCAFGAQMEALGDLDDDGYDDVVVSASLFDNGQVNEGALFVYRGSANGLELDATWRTESNVPEGRQGAFLAAAGDVVGDGMMHVIAGGNRVWVYSAEDLLGTGSLEDEGHLVHAADRAQPCEVLTEGPWGGDTYWCGDASNPGSVVASAGDVDGDGLDDLLVADPDISLPGGLGLLSVHPGRGQGPSRVPESTIELADVGSGLVSFAGHAVPVGDVDGDGYGDVAIGGYGRFHMVHGSSTGLAFQQMSAGIPSPTTYYSYNFGGVLAGAGDTNGDGYDDVIVSHVDQNVRLYLGSAAGIPTTPSVTIPDLSGATEFGNRLLGVGDMDGDGYDDVAITDVKSPTGEGRVHLYRGSSTGLESTPWASLEIGTAESSFGASLAAPGDVSGDGIDDLLVGEPGHEDDGVVVGRILLFHGGDSVSSVADDEIVHDAPGRLGLAIASLPDVDGDGHPDVASLAGNGIDEPAVKVYGSDGTGLDDTPSWSAPMWLTPFDGPSSLANAGDLNGDGYADLVIGALGIPGTDDRSGAYVWYGGEDGLTGQAGPFAITGLQELTLDEDTSVEVTVTAGAYDAANVTFTWWSDGLSLTGTGDTITVEGVEPGQHILRVTADHGGDVAEAEAVVTVHAGPPTLQQPTVWNVQEGESYDVQLLADGGRGALRYELVSGPEGTVVDPWRGTLTWTPDEVQAVQGVATFHVRVTDQLDRSGTKAWNVVVSFEDADADGLPDSWEDGFGLDLDPTADDDADGRTNAEELFEGTDPTVYEGPAIPVLVAPSDDTEVSSLTPLLRWEATAHPLGREQTYEVQILSEDLLQVVAEADVPGATHWLPESELDEDASLAWRVRASDGSISTDWSDTWFFQVNATESEPTPPVPAYPVEGAVAGAGGLTLQWSISSDPDGDAVSYEVECLDDHGAIVDVAFVSPGEEGPLLSWTPATTLVEDVMYSWRVRALDEHGNDSLWSRWEDFVFSTVDAPPAGHAFLSPEDGATGVRTTPIIELQAAVDPEGSAVVHVLQLDSQVSFDSEDLMEVVLPVEEGDRLSWSPADAGLVLRDRQDWHARVQAVDVGGVASAWEAVSFRVGGPDLPPEAPVLLAPTAGEDLEGSQPATFVATRPVDPDGDEVEVTIGLFTDSGLDELLEIREGLVGEGAVSARLELPAGHEDFWWSARAVDSTGKTSPWADPAAVSVTQTGLSAGCSTAPVSAGWLGFGLLLAGRRRRRR